MRIELLPSEPAHGAGDIPLGRVHSQRRSGDLFYAGRQPYARWDGVSEPEDLDKGAVTEAVADALEEVAAKIWGDDWSRALAEIAGINRRTTARDRIRKYGLPANVVLAVVNLAARDDAPELANLVRALTRYWEAHPDSALGGRAFNEAEAVLKEFRGNHYETRI